MHRTLGLGLLLATCGGAIAAAQDGDVAKSGMGQGEASINVRSDVKLGIKGTAGTTSERLAKLGQAVGAQMGEIRGCYRKQVAKSPEVVGGLRLELALADGAKPKVNATDPDGGNPNGGKELATCVSHVLEKASFKDVGRPAAAVLSLDFDNSRAKGQSVMNERSAATSRVDTHAAADGRQEAVWATEDNAVTFTVRADAQTPHENVELVMRGFHSGYAAFLDCRRHSEKGGTSPEGDIEATLQIDKQGKAQSTLGKVTVANARAPKCAASSLRQVTFEKPTSTVHADVLIHFAK